LRSFSKRKEIWRKEKVSKLKTPLCGKEFRSFFVKGEPKNKFGSKIMKRKVEGVLAKSQYTEKVLKKAKTTTRDREEACFATW